MKQKEGIKKGGKENWSIKHWTNKKKEKRCLYSCIYFNALHVCLSFSWTMDMLCENTMLTGCFYLQSCNKSAKFCLVVCFILPLTWFCHFARVCLLGEQHCMEWEEEKYMYCKLSKYIFFFRLLNILWIIYGPCTTM